MPANVIIIVAFHTRINEINDFQTCCDNIAQTLRVENPSLEVVTQGLSAVTSVEEEVLYCCHKHHLEKKV